MINHTRRTIFLRWAAAVLLALCASQAFAAAGKVLFVSGDVQVERGGMKPLAQGDAVEAGDVIVTGTKSRAQLLMADGAKIALRAGSRFRIDAFALPAAVNAPGQATAVAKNGSSIATLLKGGFRTATGAIGKTDPAAYEVRTPVGVLGIRGTDYTAVFCQGDCADAPGVRPGEAIRDGLYLGVTFGKIAFHIAGGPEIIVEAGQFVLIPLNARAAEPLQSPPAFLIEDGAGRLEIRQASGTTDGAGAKGLSDFGNRRVPAEAAPSTQQDQLPGTAPTTTQPIEGTDGQGRPVDITGGNLPVPPAPQRRDVSFAIGNIGQLPVFSSVAEDAPTDYVLDANGNPDSFTAQYPAGAAVIRADYQIGTATLAESGGDAATQLRWGRWSGGVAQAQVPGAPQPLDLLSRSLHWVISPDADTPPVIPQTGSVSYTLVGNTSPTNATGAVGTLGGATLTADFTNALVTSTLDLTVNGLQWSANGTGPIGAQANLPAHQFAGNYVVAITGGQVPGGTGSFSGFFSGPGGSQPGVPGGAALTFSLSDDAGLDNVQGAAVFKGP